jgi:hypothetical protein
MGEAKRRKLAGTYPTPVRRTPDFGMTMGDLAGRGEFIRVVGMGVSSIVEYPNHCEVSGSIFDDAYPMGRLITLATLQKVAQLFAVLSAPPDDVPYAMNATIGRPVTGNSGERYRPLLGLFGHLDALPDQPAMEEVFVLQSLVEQTTVADIKARFRVLPGAASPKYLQNWGLMDEADLMGNCWPLPPRVF